MIIRKFEPSDAEKVNQIITECYLNLEIGGHTPKGIDLQIEGNSPDKLIERSANIRYYIAEVKNEIVGICGYDCAKVHTFFVDINFHKKGIGGKLLNAILDKARDEGLKSIKTWSTIFAEKFYASFGFVRINEIYLPEGCKDIFLIEMEKKL